MPEWAARTGQDRNSLYPDNPIDTGAAGVNDQKNGTRYITWFKTFRPTTTPLQFDPEWLKLLPGKSRDLYPGPML